MSTENAAPADPHTPAEIGDDVMSMVAGKYGITFKPAAKADDEAGGEADGDHEGETAEQKTERLAREELLANETPEEKAEREAAEEAEREEALANETPEEKAEREAAEEAERTATEEKTKAAAAGDADLKKLPEATRKVVQGILDRRIGKITAQSKTKETELTGRISELETKLADATEASDGKPARAVVIEGIHPLFLAENAEVIEKYSEGVAAFEDWAEDHAEGYDENSPDWKAGDKPVAAADIKQRLRTLRRERDSVLPKARVALAKRAEHEAEARKLVPAFFDAKTPEYQAARTLLREQPELKRFPDYQLRVAALVLGQKALADLRTASGKAPVVKKPVVKPAPRAPGNGGAARGGVADRKAGGASSTEAAKAYAKNPTRNNLVAAASSFLTPV